MRVRVLRTGEIHTSGGIPPGTSDLISGGVFVISGAIVDQVLSAGPVTTYGQNDMVLDNWGQVRLWTATAPVISRGPSGIGFVNFGRMDTLDIQAPIQTYGPGAGLQPLRRITARGPLRVDRHPRRRLGRGPGEQAAAFPAGHR